MKLLSRVYYTFWGHAQTNTYGDFLLLPLSLRILLIIIIIIVIILWLVVSKTHMYKTWKCCHKDSKTSGELRNGALQIWRGVVRFSGDFTFCIILNSISTPHKPSFFIITNVLSVSRDLSHLFLTFFDPNLHHFINNTCHLIHFFSMSMTQSLWN